MVVLTDKSKMHFQPLLFDGFKYKSPASTYQDHYKNNRMRRQYSSATRAAEQAARCHALSQPRGTRKPINFVQNNINLYKKKYNIPVFDDEAYAREYWNSRSVENSNTHNLMVVQDNNYLKKNYQHVNFNPKVTVNEISCVSRPETNQSSYNVQLNVDEHVQKKLSSPPPQPNIVQLTTTTLANTSTTEEEKIAKTLHDSLHLNRENEANSMLNASEIKRERIKSASVDLAPKTTKSQGPMHWSIYQQDPTPDYIVEAKKRLGQIKQPHIAPNEQNTSAKPPKTPSYSSKPSTPQPALTKKPEEPKHWSQIDNPSTPDYIKQIRKRLGDDRYRRTEFTNSNSLTNLRESPVPALISKPPTPQLINDSEVYKIPNAVMSDNCDIAGSFTNYVDVLKMMPATETEPNDNEVNEEVTTAIELTEKYDSTHPNVTDQQPQPVQNERILYSRTSNDSKMSNRSDNNNVVNIGTEQQPNVISFDSWMKNHASERDKESVLKALKYVNSSACPSPCPSLSKEPSYLYNNSHYNFITPQQQQPKANQYNEYIRVCGKSPAPVATVNRRKSATPSGKTRKLGLTRGNTISSFSLDDEKKYIRDYLWNNQNSPAIVRTGYGM